MVLLKLLFSIIEVSGCGCNLVVFLFFGRVFRCVSCLISLFSLIGMCSVLILFFMVWVGGGRFCVCWVFG